MSIPDRNDPPRPRVSVDETGATVWEDTVKMEKLELMSTQRLKKLLAEEHAHQGAVREIADSAADGYLARDMATGHFKVIDDSELQDLLNDEPAAGAVTAPVEAVQAPAQQPDEDLSLVSTQALRKLLDIPESGQKAKQSAAKKEEPGGGFNPYDHG